MDLNNHKKINSISTTSEARHRENHDASKKSSEPSTFINSYTVKIQNKSRLGSTTDVDKEAQVHAAKTPTRT